MVVCDLWCVMVLERALTIVFVQQDDNTMISFSAPAHALEFSPLRDADTNSDNSLVASSHNEDDTSLYSDYSERDFSQYSDISMSGISDSAGHDSSTPPSKSSKAPRKPPAKIPPPPPPTV